MNNLEDQNTYASKFSQILEEMDIFQSEEDKQNEEENQEQGQDNPSNDDQNSDNEDNKDENNEQETQASVDADYNIDEFNLDEQLNDIESDKQNSEQIIQKNIPYVPAHFHFSLLCMLCPPDIWFAFVCVAPVVF